jgi:hypothetical protein
MPRRLCSCGYPYYEGRELNPPPGLSAESRCKNPWHPNVPGPCPNCGHDAVHPVKTLGGREAHVECRKCRNVWQPEPAS